MPDGMPQQETRDLQIPLSSQEVFTNFILGDVAEMGDGGMQLNFITMTGKMMSFPINENQAKTLGRKLLAPRVAVTDKIPPEAKEALRNGGRT